MNDSEDDCLEEESDFEDDSYQNKADFKNKYGIHQINSEDDSDSDYKREKSELELLREKNIKERDAFLAMLKSDPEYADVVTSANELKNRKVRTTNSRKEPSFRTSARIVIPIEQRRSSRLQNKPPIFFKEDLIDDIGINRKRKRLQDYDYYDLENIIYRPRKPRVSTHNNRSHILSVEEVTDSMLANIARKGTNKIYSDIGSSCHQCRQKTKDQKTCCRGANCIGIRGQFCGVCLENRYGEDVAVALKDPCWNCPVCRGICNCSFCRQKAGKRPTGILAPLAQQNGHKSVKDFLESLKGEGDYAHLDSMWQKVNDPNNLLGFSKDLKFAHMGKDFRIEINYFLTLDKMKKYILKEENNLKTTLDLHRQPNFLGFFDGTNKGLMDDGTQVLFI